MTLLVTRETIDKNADRVLERVSPSQVEAYELCPRRWYNASVRGLREEMTPAAQRGTDVSTLLEDYYLRGVEPREHPKHAVHAEIARAVTPIYGPPRPTITMEEWVVMQTEPGLPIVRGRYDLFDAHPEASTLMQGFSGKGVPVLGDTKCRSNFRYAKSADPADGDDKYLGADLQMNMYASALVEGLQLPEIGLLHAYSLTDARRPPQGKPVGIVVRAEDLLPRRRKTIESVRQMAHWAKERPDTADPLTPNTDACRKFPPKGCPYRGLCGLDGGGVSWAAVDNGNEETKAMTDRPGLTLMERMKQQRDALLAGGAPAQNGAPPPAAAPAAAPVAPPVADKPLGFCADCGTKLVAENASKLKDGRVVHAGCPAKEEVAAPAPAPEVATRHTIMTPEEPQIRAPDAPPPTQPVAEAAPQEEKKRKSRVAKAAEEMAATQVAPARPAAGAPAPSAVVAATAAEAVQSRAGAPKDLVLYVDCLPTKGGAAPVDYNEWLAPIAAEAARALGLVDWRMDFKNKSEGALAAGIRANLHTLPSSISVAGYSQARSIFMECVAPIASLVVKGITG